MLQTCKLARVCVASGVLSTKGLARRGTIERGTSACTSGR
jgi:hypothetical protein